MQVDAELSDVVPAKQVQEVMQDRPVGHGHHRLRENVRQRPQTGP
jgi:hypothetical protein